MEKTAFMRFSIIFLITHMKFLLGNCNSKFGKGDIFQPRI